ncbi:DUF3093 domain-containing protein [Pseudoclavibacter sp. RFBJ3]|uniref:DUF3093 domain-containing protein n=1 Tax=unclassified Pseudoclavibacter TaxID=2615177 RepID=UPI000CE7CAB6|nr:MULTISPECIES: DUF3093 domain-containing protein [unclassified Pseudoclavibacter]MBF4460749.1 DUF3093 domain-containing protein [Pseudoclavibacter sp. VKM Ac-2867]MBF4549183.1 DUF3093 domain-containing protein [Pseudoclavibacter sp. VKM Ac-2888]PPF40067.1 DUF3093 domain-containing protein [Pseudoclavibacter sp. AY1H1]PPF75931.1 DUF3093 domain-containing protein [Pseudoclavibacter sp. Z016]PPF84975.1 DUF3093 domain-containing protein [Pseudoclavibacter sp. RFBJ5]
MPVFHERLWPAAWVYAVGFLMVPAVILVFTPINFWIGAAIAVTLYAAFLTLVLAYSPIIEVTATQVRVAGAHVPLSFTGQCLPHTTRERARLAAGPQLDLRAWLCIRGWIPTSLTIEITDDADPVPYWLISTRRPTELAAAITEARAVNRRQTS